MDRKEFLAQLGLSGAAVFMGACMAGCSKDGSTPAPANVDFTLNLSDPANAALGSAGGFVYKNNIIIARTQSNAYIAVAQACTHEGTTLLLSEPRRHLQYHRGGYQRNSHQGSGQLQYPADGYHLTHLFLI